MPTIKLPSNTKKPDAEGRRVIITDLFHHIMRGDIIDGQVDDLVVSNAFESDPTSETRPVGFILTTGQGPHDWYRIGTMDIYQDGWKFYLYQDGPATDWKAAISEVLISAFHAEVLSGAAFDVYTIKRVEPIPDLEDLL